MKWVAIFRDTWPFWAATMFAIASGSAHAGVSQANADAVASEKAYEDAYATKNHAFLARHEFLVEAASVCGSGDRYYVEKGRYSASEQEWLRTLINYRLNGTKATYIDFEDSGSKNVSEEEINRLISSKEFSQWLGSDLIEKLRTLQKARLAFISRANELPNDSDKFFAAPTYQQYAQSAGSFFRAFSSKYRIEALSNMVDCD